MDFGPQIIIEGKKCGRFVDGIRQETRPFLITTPEVYGYILNIGMPYDVQRFGEDAFGILGDKNILNFTKLYRIFKIIDELNVITDDTFDECYDAVDNGYRSASKCIKNKFNEKEFNALLNQFPENLFDIVNNLYKYNVHFLEAELCIEIENMKKYEKVKELIQGKLQEKLDLQFGRKLKLGEAHSLFTETGSNGYRAYFDIFLNVFESCRDEKITPNCLLRMHCASGGEEYEVEKG